MKNNIQTAKSKLKPCDFTLCITVTLLLALGIIMVLSASSPSSLAETGSSYTYAIRQVQSAALGIVLMILISRVDYKKYNNMKVCLLIYAISFFILWLVLIPNVGVEVNGAKRWIKLGVQFQPSEITKIGLIIFFAAILTRNKDKIKKLSTGFFAPLICMALPLAVLVIVQDHLSATIIIAVVISIMMLMAGTRPLYFATFGTAGVSIVALGLYLMAKFTEKGAFRLARLTSFVNPWAYEKTFRVASNTRIICNRFRRAIWSRLAETVNKNTYTYQNHTTTLYLPY